MQQLNTRTSLGILAVVLVSAAMFGGCAPVGLYTPTIGVVLPDKYNTPDGMVLAANGDILLCVPNFGDDAHPAAIVRIDKDDKIVWSLEAKEIKGLSLGYVATAKRLDNGNTLVSLYNGSYAFFEITRDKKIVWSIKGGPLNATTAIEYLD